MCRGTTCAYLTPQQVSQFVKKAPESPSPKPTPKPAPKLSPKLSPKLTPKLAPNIQGPVPVALVTNGNLHHPQDELQLPKKKFMESVDNAAKATLKNGTKKITLTLYLS